MGFIGFRQEPAGPDEVVRIFLECREQPPTGAANGICCSYAVDVIFRGSGGPCRLRGVQGVLVLKKFYKLLFSLEERAREHGNDWRGVMASAKNLVKHLGYTRHARDFTGQPEPHLAPSSEPTAEPECGKAS